MKFPSEKDFKEIIDKNVIDSMDVTNFSYNNIKHIANTHYELGLREEFLLRCMKLIQFEAVNGWSSCDIPVEMENPKFFDDEVDLGDVELCHYNALCSLRDQGFTVEILWKDGEHIARIGWN